MQQDANDRTYWGEIDIPLKQVTPLHAISDKQPAADWSIGITQPRPNETYEALMAMGHTNQARIVWVLAGHSNIAVQDGSTRRFAAGEPLFVHGKGLHHTSIASPNTVTLAVTFKASDDYPFPRS